jgi:hypothetical protein
MDKRAKDKLARTPGENGGRQDAQKELQPTTRRDKMERKTQKKMERASRRRSSSAGSEKMERDSDKQKKNGRTSFNRPRLTAGCSANGRRRRYSSKCVT